MIILKKLCRTLTSFIISVFIFSFIYIPSNAVCIDYITYSISGTGAACYVDSNYQYMISGDVVIPETVTIGGEELEVIKIEYSSSHSGFSGCTNITSLEIPSGVKTVGNQAFSGCTSLEKVEFKGTTCSIGKNCFNGCEKLESVTLPSKLAEISDGCFKGCNALSDCNIPDTVAEIGKEAFYSCGFTSVDIPANVTSIGDLAFGNNKSCKSFNVSSSNTAYKSVYGVLYTNDGKTLVQFPIGSTYKICNVASGTENIAPQAFAFSTLKTVNMPSSLLTIGDDAFKESYSLSSVTLPSGLTTIGERAFLKCTALKSITIPGTVTDFENSFVQSGLETVIIESGIKEISPHAFEDCKSLKSVTVAASVEKIGIAAFKNCTALESIKIPSAVSEIGTNAFYGCNDALFTVYKSSYGASWAEDNGVSFNLIDVTGIKIISKPSKLSYNYKQSLDSSGLSVVKVMSDGSEIELSSGEYKLENTYFSSTGTKAVKVVYGDFSASFDVSVSYSFVQWIIMILLLGFLWY